MESFIYDTVLKDKIPIAICGLCIDGYAEEITAALRSVEQLNFGSYKSAFTIDYRLENILKNVLNPYEGKIVCIGASVGVRNAECMTGGILGNLSEETLSSEKGIVERNGLTLGTMPGFMAFAAEKADEKIKSAFFAAEGRDGIKNFYNTLTDSGEEFILISDGSGKGAFGAVAVRGNIITLEETICKAEQPEDFFGLKKIGIMGGTFDPIHNGHLIAAEAVRQELELDKIIFIPNGRTTYKNEGTTAGEKRFRMICAAVRSNEYFCASPIEISRKGISYTVDTVEQIREKCDADAEIFFIMGADVLKDVTYWKGFEKLAKMCGFVGVTRPGYNGGNGVVKMKEKGATVYFTEAPAMDISSSGIRRNVRERKIIKYLMPEENENFIKLHRLYTDKNERQNGIDSILGKLI